MKVISTTQVILAALLLASSLLAEKEPRFTTANKLLYMYQFYYLPFSLEFQQGRTPNDIVPYLVDKDGNLDRMITAEELRKLDSEWDAIRAPWYKRSLLNATQVNVGQTVRISQHIFSHRIPLNRTAFDTMPMESRIKLDDTLKSKPAAVQAEVKQLRHLRSFMSPIEEEGFNFFLVSASWCESCKEYRTLFEALTKAFPESTMNFHSMVIDDPKEEIFESNLLRELFPNPKKYSHESIPRFLAIQTINGKTTLWEEGDALKELYERFFRAHRGYMDSKVSLWKKSVVEAIPAITIRQSSITK